MGSQSSRDQKYLKQLKRDRYVNCRIVEMNSETTSRIESERDFSIAQSQSEKTQDNSNEKPAANVIKAIEYKVLYTFIWKKKGNEVKIAGTFNEWNIKESPIMKRNFINGNFEIELKLTRKIHQFKFIVDNEWHCSDDYEIVKDEHGNENNIIDLTNYKKENEIKNNNNKCNINNNINISANKEEPSLKKIQRTRKKSEVNPYSCVYPNENELNIDAPRLPLHYKSKFYIDYQSNQKKLKISKVSDCLSYKHRNIVSENNSYKKTLVCPHEKLLHICSSFNSKCSNNGESCFYHNNSNNIDDNIKINPKIEENNFGENNYNNNYFKISVSNRIRHRFLTIIYHTPAE